MPNNYDRPSWTVAVGPRETDPVHGDLKFAHEWDPGRPAWTLQHDDSSSPSTAPPARPAQTSRAFPAHLPRPSPEGGQRGKGAHRTSRCPVPRRGRRPEGRLGRPSGIGPEPGGRGRPPPGGGGSGTRRRAIASLTSGCHRHAGRRSSRPRGRRGSQGVGRSALFATVRAGPIPCMEHDVRLGQGCGAVQDEEHQIGLGLVAQPGPPRWPREDRPRGPGPPCRTSTDQPSSAVRIVTTSRRGAGGRVDDGPVVSGQGVEQPALPHIGPAGQDDPPAGDQSEPDLGPLDEGLEFLDGPTAGSSSASAPQSSRSSRSQRLAGPRSGKISAERTVGARDSRPRPRPRPPTARRGGPRDRLPLLGTAATSASTTKPTAAGPPWQWISTSGASPSKTTATTSSPNPLPARPIEGHPAERRSAGPRVRAENRVGDRQGPRAPQADHGNRAPALRRENANPRASGFAGFPT